MTQARWFRIRRATWWITAIVVWGNWNAQTDWYPFNENQARPSWYVYGWPICFGTSGRGRMNFSSFDARALVVDLTLAVVIVACTIVAAEILCRHMPQLTISDMLAITAGFSIMLLLWTGGLYYLWEWTLGAVLPQPDWSASAGNAQPTDRLSPAITFPLSMGLGGVGFAMVALPLIWVNARARRYDS